MARPRGGEWLELEVNELLKNELTCLISALETSEIQTLGLEQELDLSKSKGIQFEWFPIPDMGVPSSKIKYLELVLRLSHKVKAKEKIIIHCRQGIGRTSIIAAGILMNLGYSLNESIDLISNTRGVRVPESDTQLEFLRSVEESIRWD